MVLIFSGSFVVTSRIFRQPSKSFILKPLALAPTNLPSSKTSIAVNFAETGALGKKDSTLKVVLLIILKPKSVPTNMLSSLSSMSSFRF